MPKPLKLIGLREEDRKNPKPKLRRAELKQAIRAEEDARLRELYPLPEDEFEEGDDGGGRLGRIRSRRAGRGRLWPALMSRAKESRCKRWRAEAVTRRGCYQPRRAPFERPANSAPVALSCRQLPGIPPPETAACGWSVCQPNKWCLMRVWVVRPTSLRVAWSAWKEARRRKKLPTGSALQVADSIPRHFNSGWRTHGLQPLRQDEHGAPVRGASAATRCHPTDLEI